MSKNKERETAVIGVTTKRMPMMIATVSPKDKERSFDMALAYHQQLSQ
jgi:hypothetical protein